MKELIKVYLLLFVVHLAARFAVSFLIFRHVDLRFEIFAQIMIVPVCQAVLLAWLLGDISASRWIGSWASALRRRPSVAAFLLVDFALLGAGWWWSGPGWFDLTQAGSIAGRYTGVKVLAASLLVIQAGIAGNWSRGERAAVVLFGMGLGAYGTDYFSSWLEPLPGLLLPAWPALRSKFLVYGALFVTTILLLLKIETIWKRRSAHAGSILSSATAMALLGALVVVVHSFNRQFLLPPWSGVASTCAFLAISAILAAIVSVRAELAAQPVAQGARVDSSDSAPV